MNLSVVEPLTPAWNRTAKLLFKPFDFVKWLLIAIAAWLAHLLEGGVNFSFNFNPGRGGGIFRQAFNWMTSHVATLIIFAAVALVLGAAITVAVSYLRSRGKFMLIHALVVEKFDLGQAWSARGEQANSLFRFYCAFMLIWFIGSMLFLALIFAVAFADIKSGRFGISAVLALAMAFFVGLPLFLVSALINFITECFVVPVMYHQRIGIAEAWRLVWSRLLSPYKGEVILFFLFQIVLGIGVGIIVGIVTLCTCCIAGLPFINRVVFLPIFVFFRAYSIYFLQQLGPEFQVFPPDKKGPPICPACGYDLRGNPGAPKCPECGVDIPPGSFDAPNATA